MRTPKMSRYSTDGLTSRYDTAQKRILFESLIKDPLVRSAFPVSVFHPWLPVRLTSAKIFAYFSTFPCSDTGMRGLVRMDNTSLRASWSTLITFTRTWRFIRVARASIDPHRASVAATAAWKRSDQDLLDCNLTNFTFFLPPRVAFSELMICSYL